jgi:hypothetical protein
MAALRIRFLLAATLALGTGGLFLAAAAPAAGATAAPAAALCGGPFGPNSTYCVTIIKPVPLGNSR